MQRLLLDPAVMPPSPSRSYESVSGAGAKYPIRLLERKNTQLLTCPVGKASYKPVSATRAFCNRQRVGPGGGWRRTGTLRQRESPLDSKL
jgi:hypothetical protein